jgi:hypothetical protein
MGTRWGRWAGGAGFLFVVLFVASFFIAHTPDAGASAAKISHYYVNHKTVVDVSGLLTYLAVFVGVWFFVNLWHYFRSFPGLTVAAVVSLVGAVLFATSGALAAGINFTFADHTKSLNDGALVALNSLENDLTYPMTIVGLALFYAGTGVVIRKGRAFPQWLGWVSWLLAVVALVPPVAFFAFLATALWVLVVSVLLWRMPARSIDLASPRPPSADTRTTPRVQAQA